MDITPSTISGLFQTYETLFNKALSTAKTVWPDIAMKVPSGGEASVYAWMEQFSGMREWIGPRLFDDIKANGYTLTNIEWEKSLQIRRTRIADDSYGVYNSLVEQMGAVAAYHPDAKIGSLLDNGFTNLCWDGKAFYATDHVKRTTGDGETQTFDNYMNKALDAASYEEARQRLRRNLGGGDNPFMSAFQTTLIVPAELESTARRIIVSERDSFGADNPNAGTSKLVVLNSLENTKQWHLHVTDNPIKALIYQEREAPKTTSITDPNDSSVKETGYFKFMADYRGAYGYALPILAIGSTGGN